MDDADEFDNSMWWPISSDSDTDDIDPIFIDKLLQLWLLDIQSPILFHAPEYVTMLSTRIQNIKIHRRKLEAQLVILASTNGEIGETFYSLYSNGFTSQEITIGFSKINDRIVALLSETILEPVGFEIDPESYKGKFIIQTVAEEHTDLIITRLNMIMNFFGYQLLDSLEIEFITVKQLEQFPYLRRINYLERIIDRVANWLIEVQELAEKHNRLQHQLVKELA